MSLTEVWIERDDPIVMVEGTSKPITYKFDDDISSPSLTVYKDYSDVTSTVLSGSNSVSGNILTTKTMTAQSGHGGSEYIMTIQVVIGGKTEIYKDRIKIVAPGAG